MVILHRYVTLPEGNSLEPNVTKSLCLGFGHQVISLWRRGRGGVSTGVSTGSHGAHGARHGHRRHHAVRGVAHVGHTHAWHHAKNGKNALDFSKHILKYSKYRGF